MALLGSLLKIFLSFNFAAVSAETYIVRVGTENHVNEVSKNFLSFTVDPKYLFSSGEKYGSSQECICMAASLTPAYLRIAGPSTAHMNFHNTTITIDPQQQSVPKRRLLKTFLRKRKRQATVMELDKSFERDAKEFLGKALSRVSRQADERSPKNIPDVNEEHERVSEKSVKKHKKKGSFSRKTDERKLESNVDEEPRQILENLVEKLKKKTTEKVEVSIDEWKRFSAWSKAAGFEIVFALNNEEKTKSGLWDPSTTLDILSVAEKEGVKNIYWQLGYECTNQTIDEYLNDLQTLRLIVETLPGRERGWKVVGADVTACLRDSKSDFKDYVALSLDMADALMLNGNSSSYELARLSPPDRSKLLRLVHDSSAPLWVSERSPLPQSELNGLARAAAWLASLGHAARRGARAHFRELTAHELYQPTLSFYMALLFKNLVGERVLNVDMESSHTVLFAHCTSLRRQVVPGAVTLYGANMDDEPARLSLKLSRREEGGDIMQFILSQNEDGNIIVNGREMSQEGDIRPVVRRVRPYKTLLLNLPSKSFGFWVLANTKVQPCQYIEENDEETLVEAEPVNKEAKDEKKVRSKRSLINAGYRRKVHVSEDTSREDEYDVVKTGNKEFDAVIEKVNNLLRQVHNTFVKKPLSKVKRQTFDGQITNKLKRQLIKIRNDLKSIDDRNKPVLGMIGNLLQFARNETKNIGNNRFRNFRFNRNRIGKRYDVQEIGVAKKPKTKSEGDRKFNTNNKVTRTKRSLTNDDYEDINENDYLTRDEEKHAKENDSEKSNESYNTKEYDRKEILNKFDDLEHLIRHNEVEGDNQDNKKIWKVLHNIQNQLKRMSEERKSEMVEESYTSTKSEEPERLVVRTEITDEGTTIQFKEQPNGGWVKSTFENVFYTLNDLNENLNKFLESITLFE